MRGLTYVLRCVHGHQVEADAQDADDLSGTACPACGKALIVEAVRTR